MACRFHCLYCTVCAVVSVTCVMRGIMLSVFLLLVAPIVSEPFHVIHYSSANKLDLQVYVRVLKVSHNP